MNFGEARKFILARFFPAVLPPGADMSDVPDDPAIFTMAAAGFLAAAPVGVFVPGERVLIALSIPVVSAPKAGASAGAGAGAVAVEPPFHCYVFQIDFARRTPRGRTRYK